ncbi:response regulator [Bacteriovorax sp. Seq25_V]|uniref:response regulator n=1 Tax=Bacteriovorax sp. Seq25_V TaxID=1201288 RepID=UPI00038A2578|nr:response regulator [Bacteriovorax sp. Seq25_V]EQC48062.1 response regulator receiver domain protein [Bacteriovorax sp. Seq25_V]
MAANIVLVDDDEKIATLSGTSLISKGYNVEIFFNPNDALSFISSNHDYTILITDNIMPEINGQELIEQVLTTRPEVLAILATGDDAYGIDLSKYNGRVMMVSKPFKRKDLIETIEKLCNN